LFTLLYNCIDVSITMQLLEEMTDVRVEEREAKSQEMGGRAPPHLVLYAYCSTGTNPEDPYRAVEVCVSEGVD
jgi:hypothetical protein